MKKFRFRLEALLKLRQHREREAQREHALAQLRTRNQEQSLADVDRRRQNTVSSQTHVMEGAIDPSRVLLFSRYIQRLRGESATGGEVLKALRKSEASKRGELMEAARKRRVYERLREKWAEQHRREGAMAEMKDMDEIAIVGHRAKSSHP